MEKITCFSFNKQRFYKQLQADIGKKLSKELSYTLRLNFNIFKSNRYLHPRFCYIFSGYWRKNDNLHIIKLTN